MGVLYYDKSKDEFTPNRSDNCEILFECYEREERIGLDKGNNPPIKKGPFEITIKTNFYPQSPERQYISISITVNGILLLPISMACRKAVTNIHFSKHDIAFLQYGIGNNQGKEPVTIFQRNDEMNWDIALQEVCDICNNYEEWIIKETKLLIAKLREFSKTDFNSISTLLSLVRGYETIAPNVISVFRKFVDPHCFDAMRQLIIFIENNKMKALEKVAKKKRGDILWAYIKDYYLENSH